MFTIDLIQPNSGSGATPLAPVTLTRNDHFWCRRVTQTAAGDRIALNSNVWAFFLKLLFITAFSASIVNANVCTPVSAPANGPFPAVVNGIDQVSWSVARIQWASDGAATAANYQRIVYTTANQWSANGNSFGTSLGQSYYVQGLQQTNVTSSTAVQGGLLTNLLPGTTYYVAGESSPDGTNWCTISGGAGATYFGTFTTGAAPTTTKLPIQPAQVPTTQPSLNGTHWVYGTNCGTAGGSVTANVQDCFNKAQPGDDIGFSPGTYPITQVNVPDSSAYSFSISCTQTTSTCTQSSGSPPSNGTQVVFYLPPAPINPGIPYKIINVSGSSFQISYDGVNPITFTSGNNAVGTPWYELWPITRPWITVHSTASASVLPPAGVRLGPDALAQYQPNMPIFQAEDPGVQMFSYTNLAAGWWWQNIGFSTDPTIATTNGNGMDPIGFGVYQPYIVINTVNSNITYNQCAFIPAKPPSRSKFIGFDGSNVAVMNSYQDGLDWWQPAWFGPNVSSTSTTATIPAATVTWVGPGGTLGIKQSCSIPTSSFTVTGGSGSGNFRVWMDPSCNMHAQLPSTVTATASNLTITQIPPPTVTAQGTGGSSTYTYCVLPMSSSTVSIAGCSDTTTFANGNPTLSTSNYNAISWSSVTGASSYYIIRNGYQVIGPFTGTTAKDTGQAAVYSLHMTADTPLYLWNSPVGISYSNYNAIALDAGQISNGSISGWYPADLGHGAGTYQGGGGFYESGGPGPLLVQNNYMTGGQITGVFLSSGLTDDWSPCINSGVACSVQYNPGQLTEQRNTETTNPCYFSGNSCWNGGDYYWRNLSEVKHGKIVLQNGNIYGPFHPEVGEGQCILHYVDGGHNLTSNSVDYTDSSEWTFTNNTCKQTGAGLGIFYFSWYGAMQPHIPVKDVLIANNLFLNDNAYSLVPPFSTTSEAKAVAGDSTGGCGNGYQFEVSSSENVIFRHNTAYGQAGCLSFAVWGNNSLSSGQITDNIFNLTLDTSGFFAGATTTGTLYQTFTTDTPSCASFQGSAFFGCINNFTWAGNVMLPTYADGYPATLTDFNSAQISTAQSLMPANTLFPPGSNVASRIAAMHWFNPTTGNLRLSSSSPYISGALNSYDGTGAGADMDALDAAQGNVWNVRVLGSTRTSATLAFLAPDSFGCSVDWSTANFTSGTGTWTRVTNSGGQRVQNVALTGLPADSLIYYRLNCAAQQPTGTIQLP